MLVNDWEKKWDLIKRSTDIQLKPELDKWYKTMNKKLDQLAWKEYAMYCDGNMTYDGRWHENSNVCATNMKPYNIYQQNYSTNNCLFFKKLKNLITAFTNSILILKSNFTWRPDL